ncbi:hypothetical protein HCU64_25090, partial [Methylobacterium sp. C25]|uniref:phosphopantetheine-binding protein n=1 Tax=Methylobacterium sp. C25 TaxID=2721622 RepID=UPI001F4781C4
AHLVVLDSFPLTPNGKLDRRALPAPEAALAQADDYVAPRNPVETALAAIWAEILGLPRIGVTQNFFETGGDSLQAIRVVSRLRQRFDHPCSPKDLFERPTIEALSRVFEPSEQGAVAGAKAKQLDALLSAFEDA